MPITDSYGQGFTSLDYGETPDLKVMGESLLEMAGQTVMSFASATARTATLAAPVEGMVTWLQDANRLYVYDGSAWVEVPVRQNGFSAITSSTSQTSSEILTGLSITMATRAATTYVLKATGLVRSTLATDRIDLLIRRGSTTGGTQVGGGVLFTQVVSTGESLTAVGKDTPGAGTTTWVVTLSGVGSGLVDLTASSAFPAVFTVEEQ